MSVFEWFWEKVTKPMDEKRIKTLRVPVVAREDNDICYVESDHKMHLLDVYAPVDSFEKMPTIIDVHGGGWYYGDKELNKIYCLNLVERGFRVVNLSYRLTPEVSLKEQVQDLTYALNYVYDNADSLGVDLNNLFLTGDSAGAHLSAMLVNLSYDQEMSKAFGVTIKPTFKAVCYTCAAFYISKLATTPIVRSYFTCLLGKKAGESPLFPYVDYRADFARIPSLFITSDGDFMKGQTLRGYEEATKEGIETELIYIKKEDQENKLTHVFNVIQPDWSESKLTNDKTVAFFKKYID